MKFASLAGVLSAQMKIVRDGLKFFNGGLIVLRGYYEAAKEDEKEKMLPERKEAPSDGKAGQSNVGQSSSRGKEGTLNITNMAEATEKGW